MVLISKFVATSSNSVHYLAIFRVLHYVLHVIFSLDMLPTNTSNLSKNVRLWPVDCVKFNLIKVE